MSISFNGLASGIDTAALIDGLVSAEKASAAPYSTQKTNLEGQKSVVTNLSTALTSFGTLATGMKTATELQPRKATSSDAHVSIAVSSNASPTTHAVRVVQTARAQVVSSRTFASPDAGVLGTGGLTIGTTAVAWSATDSLADIAGRITAAKAGVSASVLFDGSTYRLVMTADATGTAAAPTLVDSGDGLDASNVANVKIPARDAIVQVDGIPVTRGKNVIDDAIPGVTITALSAHATADPDGLLTVSLDSDGVQSKLAAFVKSYNGIASGLNAQMSYTGDGTTKKSASSLFGDSTIRQLQGRLASIMSTSYGGKALGEIGLSRDRDGFLALDQTKLDKALAADPDAIAKVFATGGFAAQVAKFTDDYARSGDGILAVKTASLTSQSKLLQSQIDQIDTNSENLRSRLQDQFGKLEKAMSLLKSQSSYISRMLG
ncbi:MAG: flagellar filament capping protein FliD [Proteobacteria bacterium]|nr:flagellar filament capping protein FliD [Pseudomonadota bacterium]